MSNRNREAGHDWERACVNILKDRNIYPNAATSREVSGVRDHRDKIDICNRDEREQGIMTDSIQCKNVASSLTYSKLMSEMADIPGTRKVILHKQTRRAGKKFVTVGTYAITQVQDYYDLLAHWRGFQLLFSELLEKADEDTKAKLNAELVKLGII